MSNTIAINNSTTSVNVTNGAITVGTEVTDRIPPNSPLDMGSLTTLFNNMTPIGTPPSSPAEDDIYLDNGNNTASGTLGFRRYTGTEWEDVGVQTLGDTVSLSDLNDVTISAIVDGERLVYNATTEDWENVGTIDGGSY